jgi:MSHA pilin protein MshA
MLRNQKGFTLIEIIAVLVILGILAAVAIPKFLDLQTQSANRALAGALAEGVSSVSMGYSSAMLIAGRDVSVTAATDKATANKPSSEEFDYTFTATDVSRATVNVLWKAGKKPTAAADTSKSKVVILK